MLYNICVTAVVSTVLTFLYISRNFITLSVGNRYRTRDGELVEIINLRRHGKFKIFEGSNGAGYFNDGTRVGDIITTKKTSLWRRL